MVNLSLTEKGGGTSELSFDKDEVSVGRVRGNDIVLPKGNVSKHHCRLLIRGEEVVVEDLHSTNGTYVNGRRISEPTAFATTDRIFVGDFVIRLNVQSVSMEAIRPTHQPGPPEAGSLSSAIPRRAPPPPPPARATLTMDAPPSSFSAPAHPPKAEGMPFAAPSEPLAPPSGPSDIDLDDEDDGLGTPHPHISVPPLRPAVQPTGSLIDPETPHGSEPDDRAPGRVHAPSASADDFAPPPPPSGAYDEDLGEPNAEAQPALVRPPQIAADKPVSPKRSAPERQTPNESPKSKAAHQTAAKNAARALDRDVPDWLARLVEGDGVAAVYFTGTSQVEVQRHGRREAVSVAAPELATVSAVVRKLAAKGSPKPVPDAPVINTTLPDGIHISAIFPPVADRLCVAIRRPIASGKTIDDLVSERVISAEMRQVLEACLATRQNILLSGDRAACDSLLRALLWSVDRVARLVLLSDAISPPASATAWIKLQAESQAPDLVAAAVAMQPEYLVVDANHLAHSSDVLTECSLGLQGVILSLVARSAHEAVHRVQLLGAPAASSGAANGDQVLSSIDVVVQASVLSDGSLKVVEIAEPKASLDGQVTASALLTWIPDDGGSFTVTGARSALAAKLSAEGSPVPPQVLTP